MTKKLQVFVSSTYSDLKVERQAAVGAILKAGHIPAGMELFTAGDQSQWETIKAWIDESDIYMLILGGRYGSIETTTGLAYTELEYDYALAQGKPLFAIVITEAALDRKVRESGTSFFEKENGKLLAAFRNKVLSNISSFFEDEKDIRLAVYESVADVAANRSLKGWVRGDSLVNTTPLLQEINKLSSENEALRAQIAELQRSPANRSKTLEFEEMRKVLNATEIEVPAELAHSGITSSMTVLNVFSQLQAWFVTGVTNGSGMSEFSQFIYFKLAVPLQIHGLVQFEKIAGVRFRRCILTPKGAEFLSALAKWQIMQRDQLEKGKSAQQIEVPKTQNVGDAKEQSKPALPKAKKSSTTAS